MSGSTFCACPEGDSPSAKRQYDAIMSGCIPVLVSNDAIFAFSTDNEGPLDPDAFSLRITEESVVFGESPQDDSPWINQLERFCHPCGLGCLKWRFLSVP